MNKLLILIIYLTFFGIDAQNKPHSEISIDQLTTETQFSSDNQDSLDLVWWIPTEFWEVTSAQDGMTSKEEINALVEMLEDYIVVMVLKGKLGLFGGVTYDSEEDIRSETKTYCNGTELRLLEDNELTPDLKNFASVVQPMLKNMMGPMGENLQFFVYANPKGETILPIRSTDTHEITFELGEFNYDVSLPLSSLLEEKLCPDDQVAMNGKWAYCPFHGTKLVTKE